MKAKRWIMPTVSIAAAIAMAVSGGLIGSTFAAHTTNQVSSGTEIVPVVAPVSIGLPPADEHATRPDGSYAVSEAVAEREVRVPASDPSALDPALLDLIGSLAESDDPAATLNYLGRFGDSDSVSGDDDPCAPRNDSDTSDCPAGLQSTVLPLVGRPNFWVNAQPFPPTEAEYRADPDDSNVWCDGPTASPTSVPLGILSTVPATFTVRYWPSAHPDEVAELDTIQSSAEEIANFDEALLAAEDSRGIPLIRHCASFDDLEADTNYTAVVFGIDTDFRISSPLTLRFNSAGAPTHPGARIVPLGDNLVFVSALHPSHQLVDIRAVVRPPDAIPSCSDVDSGRSLTPLTDTETETTVEKLIAARVPEDFLSRHAVTFAAPEGSTLLVCARWYRASDVAAWHSVQPLFESSAIVQAPDLLAPVVELSAVAARQWLVESITVQVSTEQGRLCGENTWHSSDSADSLPLVLCDSTGNTGTAKLDSRGRLVERGASNDLVLRIGTNFRDGGSMSTRAYIASVDGGCRGECFLPEDRYYALPIGMTEQTTGLCGASFGGCTPPTAEVSAGTIQVKVSWKQGDTNGRSTWNVTPTSDVAPEYVAPDEPQLNLSSRWSFDAPGYEDSPTAHRPLPFVTGRFPLSTDRPVDYVVRLTQGDSFVPARGCDSTGGLLEARGHNDTFTPIVIPGVCLGEAYVAEIDLVDADGHITTWNLQDRNHYWGAGSIRNVPEIRAQLDVDLQASGPAPSVLSNYYLIVNDQGFNSDETRSGRCLDTGELHFSESREVSLGARVQIAVSLRLQAASTDAPDSCSVRGDGDTQYLTAPIDLADLYGRGGVTLALPSMYNLRLKLQAQRPYR